MSTQDAKIIDKNLIFNPLGKDNVENRTIIKGNTTGLFNLNAVKYQWAKSLYQVMIGNFWVPEKVSGLKDDARDFQTTLNAEEQRAYKGILSFLIFLDSIQTVNLPNFSNYITSPEVNLILAIQAYQESIHSQSYATILESVVNSEERDEIYYFWRENTILLERNKYIGQIYQDFIDTPTDYTFFRGIIANFLLESLYFYNGFAFFDTLVDHMKMPATGNGRRQSYAYPPMPRMTNTYMLNGDKAPEEIIASVKQGLYAVNFGGGQVDITSGKFVFSAAEAYMIENGKITYPVKGATLIGNGPDVLTRVSMIGNDLSLDPGIGTCGKEGQSVPVGVGQPTMRIDGLTVGGTGN